jgi:endonuclease/exonuclease/phosphatase family metal-dependent hydrolase
MRLRVLTINIADFQFGWFGASCGVVPEKRIRSDRRAPVAARVRRRGLRPYSNAREYEVPRLGWIGVLSRFAFLDVEVRKLADRYDRLIVGGDLNATEDEEAIRLFRDRFVDAARGATWSSANDYVRKNLDRRIDYLFHSPSLRCHEARVVLARRAPVFPSDHFGVSVTFA